MDYDTILLESSEKMDHCVEHFKGELRGVRSGRASPGLVDSLKVDYYGSPTPLGQMAQISVPEPRQIVKVQQKLPCPGEYGSKQSDKPSGDYCSIIIHVSDIVRSGRHQ